MLYRTLLIVALGLLVLATACPKQGADQSSETDQAADEQPPKVAVIRASPISTIEKMINAMNKGDREGYELLLAADGPAHDELLTKFDEFDSATATISLEDASVQSQQDTEATVIYDLKVKFDNPDTKPEYETGRFVLHFADAQWLIWETK